MITAIVRGELKNAWEWSDDPESSQPDEKAAKEGNAASREATEEVDCQIDSKRITGGESDKVVDDRQANGEKGPSQAPTEDKKT